MRCSRARLPVLEPELVQAGRPVMTLTAAYRPARRSPDAPGASLDAPRCRRPRSAAARPPARAGRGLPRPRRRSRGRRCRRVRRGSTPRPSTWLGSPVCSTARATVRSPSSSRNSSTCQVLMRILTSSVSRGPGGTPPRQRRRSPTSSEPWSPVAGPGSDGLTCVPCGPLVGPLVARPEALGPEGSGTFAPAARAEERRRCRWRAEP